MRKLFFVLFLFLFLNSFCLAVEVNSPHAVLIDLDTGRVLFEKNAYEQAYPASTTKILTAILVLEHCDLDEKVTASSVAVNSVYDGGTIASIQPGETLTVRDLLRTLLVHSANDASYVLAEHVGGTIDSFVSMMNARAKELGAKNTYYLNPNGLPNKDHKSTAYDTALFAQYAMKNFEFFRETVKMDAYTLPITEEYSAFYKNQNPSATTVIRYPTATTNHMINPHRTEYFEDAIGIKTGYTGEAKNCLVGGATRDGVTLISVIFGANGWKELREDTVNLFEYGFSLLRAEPLTTAGATVDSVKISNGVKGANILDLVAEDSLSATVHKMEEVDTPSPVIAFVKGSKLKAPIKKGDVVGTVSYTVNQNTYTTKLLAGNDVEERETIIGVAATVVTKTASALVKILLILLAIAAVLLILLIILRAYFVTKRQKKRIRRRNLYNARFR